LQQKYEAMRIIFMGTPDFAVASLKALLEAGHQIIAVVTAPDTPAGRKGTNISAVKRFAMEHALTVLQPLKLKSPEFIDQLRSLNADIQVVVAFRMLPEVVWNMPPQGTINLHGSLLPLLRGAAPIHWAVMRGETQTGVTTFRLKHEIDTGELLFQEKMEIGPDETTTCVHDRMMVLGAQVMVKTIEAIQSGTSDPVPQTDELATHAPKLNHEICQIDFGRTQIDVHNFIRGLSLFPGAWTLLNGDHIKILRAKKVAEHSDLLPSYLLIDEKRRLYVGTQSGAIEILVLQPEGKKRLDTHEFLNGWREDLVKFGD
jgi:methionyl-tRNA formyltransferase